MRARGVILAAFVVVVVGCRRPSPEGASQESAPLRDAVADRAEATEHASDGAIESDGRPLSDALPAEATLPPLAAPEASRALAVPGHGDAIVILPLGTTRPRPIVVALHGLWDRPEWQCSAWGPIVHGRAFVLCPRGTPSKHATRDDPRLTYTHAEAMAKEVDDAIDALRAAYPAYVDPGPAVYTGFSLGAIYGVPCVAAAPKRFPRVILVEGGHEAWTTARARAFTRNGGERIVFLCGSDDCPIAAGRATGRLAAAGMKDVRIHALKGAGHTYGGFVFDDARDDIEWALAEGDPRFAD